MTKNTEQGSPAEARKEASAARRLPAQQRSRERLERILAAASQLIAQNGSDHVRMSEVASLAGISIGSLYQYFPDKAAIIRMLAERYAETNRQCIAEALAEVDSVDSLLAAFSRLVDDYRALFQAEPVMRDIWSGMQADKQLAALELEENKASAALLAAAMRRAHPGADVKRTALTAYLIWQLGESTMRLALSHNRREGAVLIDAYKRMSTQLLAEP